MGLKPCRVGKARSSFEYFISSTPVDRWSKCFPLQDNEYPLRVINWKTPQFIGLVGGLDNPWLQEVSQNFDPYAFGVCINPFNGQGIWPEFR